jgi:acetyl/propionyl-CoA carboxylase alpha subunit
MFKRILIANRGEIACRVIKTARRMGIATVAVYSDADRDALHVATADEAVHIGPAEAAQSYLNVDAILDAARQTGADAIHPGYGFLSERVALAEGCKAAGIVWVGPNPEAITRMGSKIESKRIAEAAHVPCVPGYHGAAQDDDSLAKAAAKIGYPVLIKASAGGGGRGMRAVMKPEDLSAALALARAEAQAGFGDPSLLIEKLIQRPRHLEVQLAGDKHGNLIHLYERECSIQRNYQKLIEEAPAPNLRPEIRSRLLEAALNLGNAIGYDSLGTVEFILDADGGGPWFLEMNTRLQVEHPVTELVTGLDLVELQIRVAAGEHLPLTQEQIHLKG